MFQRSFALDIIDPRDMDIKCQLRAERTPGGVHHLYAYFFDGNGFIKKTQLS